MKLKIGLIFGVFAAILVLAGCSSMNTVRKSRVVLSGLCDDDREKLKTAYDSVERGMTKEYVVKNTCIHPDTKNVHKLQGSKALDHFGLKEVRRDTQSPSSVKEYLLETENYSAWVIPYIKLRGKEEGNLIDSEKKLRKSGADDVFSILFYKDEVLIKEHTTISRDETDKEEKSVWGSIVSGVFNFGLKYGRKF